MSPDHLVHFWDQEAALHEAVAAYLADGLTAGGTGLFIGQPDHWSGVARLLGTRGFDIPALQSQGRLVVIDAEQTLPRILIDDMPDASRFRDVMGTLIDELSARGRVHVFGEMVDILWRRGHSTAALRLEDLWNALAHDHSFSLLCGYALGGRPDSFQPGAVEAIGAYHGGAAPPHHPAPHQGPQLHQLQERANALEAELTRRRQLEAALRDALAARQRADESARRSQGELAEQIEGLSRLHELTMQVAGTFEQRPLLEAVLGAAAAISGTNLGVLSLCGATSELEAGASLGVDAIAQQALRHLDFGLTPCGETISGQERVVIEDVTRDDRFERLRPVARAAGFVGMHSTPLVTRAGRALGVLSIFFRDPHRPSEREEYLIDLCARQAGDLIENQRLYARLQENDRRKNQFLATLAHELRNPLAPIRNAVQILRAPATLPAGRDFAVDVIDRQVGQMARLIEDLIDVSRVTTGRLELRSARVDVREFLQHAMETSRPLIEAGGQELLVTLPARALIVDGDATRLAQVVSNLLNNAARYTNRGGRITLSAEPRDGEAVIVVKDTGIGIPANMLERVFDVFARSDEACRRSQGSLGIGLTLARQLVTLHHGTIAADSDGPGTGSTFTVRLPLAPAAVTALRVQPAESAAPATALRVLVVDDNVDSAETMAVFLGALGHDVRMGHDGIEAVIIASEFQPDVILLDIGLPGQSGYDVARAVRTEPWSADTCIVAVSGWSQESDRALSREAGFDHHLVKPVDHAVLRHILATRSGATRSAAP